MKNVWFIWLNDRTVGNKKGYKTAEEAMDAYKVIKKENKEKKHGPNGPNVSSGRGRKPRGGGRSKSAPK